MFEVRQTISDFS